MERIREETAMTSEQNNAKQPNNQAEQSTDELNGDQLELDTDLEFEDLVDSIEKKEESLKDKK